MEPLLEFWKNQWNAYPEWLVVSSLAIVAAVVLWLVAKSVAWLIKWLLIGAALTALVCAVLYFVG